MRIASLLIVGVVAVISGCGDSSTALAQLLEARGPIDRQSTEGTWSAATAGTKFYLQEAARTADGEALLRMLDGARFTMKPHTILRFGGTADAVKMGLDFGELQFRDESGTYSFDFGVLRLNKATGTVTAEAPGKAQVLFSAGAAELFDGTTRKVDHGVPILISGFKIIDAKSPETPALADAGVDAPATSSQPQTVVPVDVKGKTVEVQLPGQSRWTKLPPGKHEVPPGAKLRIVSGNSSARLISYGTSLEMARSAKVGIESDLSFAVEAGIVTASVPIGGTGAVGLPGGRLTLKGTSQTPSSASINVSGRGDAKVTVLMGLATLIGDAMHAMSRGETAALVRSGKIEIIAEIPKTFDIAIPVGDKVNLHDPKGATAVKFTFPGKCPGNGVIEVDRSTQFAAVQSSEDKDLARIKLTTGMWFYRLRCVTAGGVLGPKVESGYVTVMRDSGERKLPRVRSKFLVRWDDLLRTPPLDFVFQAEVPDLVFDVGKTNATVTIVRSDRTQKKFSGTGKITAEGPQLSEGQLNVTVENGKDTRRTLINLIFNNMSPIVFIAGPPNGKPWGNGPIIAKGAVLPGWTAAIDGVQLPLSASRSFEKAVARPTEATAIAIKMSHPKHGVHYYLRREAR